MRSSYASIIFAFASLATAADSSSLTSVPTYAPLPSTAFGPPVSHVTGFRVEAFGEGAYLMTDGLYQSLFLVTCDGVVVVDAPPTIGHNLLTGIGIVTDLPISHVVYSHAHADHIGAAYLLGGEDVTFIAHELTAMELAQVNDPNRPMPNITFSQELEVTACNQTLQLSYKGPNHEPGNIFIYAPVQKVLMLVDIVYPGWVPFDQLAESQNIPGFIKAHTQILDYDFDHYLGGHLDRAGTRQDVLTQKDYVSDLQNNCVEAILLSGAPPNASNPLSVQAVLPPVEAANPGNGWAVFAYYIDDLLTSWCANKTNEKWLGVLGGADVYGLSNAKTMIESVRIDFGILGPYGVSSG